MDELTNGHSIALRTSKKLGAGVALLERRITKNGKVNHALEKTFQKVERAKQEWESAVDALPELICVTDYRGKIVRANRTVEQWKLGAVVSVEGLSFHELLHPGCERQDCYFVSFFEGALQRSLADRPAELEAYDAILGRHVLIQIHPVTAKKKVSPRTVAIVIQDITQRKQMEEALQNYNNRLETMNRIGEAILAANSPQQIARAALSRMRQLVPFQRALLTLCNARFDELLVIDVYADGATHTHQEKRLPREAFALNGSRGLDNFLLIKDLSALSDLSYVEQQFLGEGIHSYLSIPLIAQDNFIGALILGANRPGGFDQEQIEIATEVGDLLAIATHQAGLHQKLELANEGLQQALQAREEMLQNVSHELNTPLAIMRGYADLMKDEAFGNLTPDQIGAVDIMLGKADQLEFLVKRLLTLQSLDKKAHQYNLLALEPLLESVVESWQLRASSVAVELGLDVYSNLPKIVADPNLLTLVISNLIDNAVKFSPGGGKVTVRVWAEGRELHIAVSDEGIGIAPEKLVQIFERFVQADGGTTRSFGGMGIGLALCYDIVDAHGGRIWAESAGRETGSTFYVVLPANSGLRQFASMGHLAHPEMV